MFGAVQVGTEGHSSESLSCSTMCQAAPLETEGKPGKDNSLKKARKLRLMEKAKEVVEHSAENRVCQGTECPSSPTGGW